MTAIHLPGLKGFSMNSLGLSICSQARFARHQVLASYGHNEGTFNIAMMAPRSGRRITFRGQVSARTEGLQSVKPWGSILIYRDLPTDSSA